MIKFLRFCSRHKFLSTLFFLVLMSGLAILFHRPILLAVGNYLTASDPPEKADVIRVLGGSPDRYIYGIELYKHGFAPKIIFSMWDNYLPLFHRSISEAVHDYAQAEKIPESAVEITSAVSTYNEAVLTKEMIEKNGFKSVLIVSSPYHMHRAAMIFRHVIGKEAKLIFVAVPSGWTDFKTEWWKDEESTVAVIHEYVGIVYYFFKYILF
ncbi:YdcF family protein [Candidatus Acetothermia bacterium]|nr:YdcF family protein [Candidatus Acetothermia bacterium]MBI3642985.1 YdcF family protein [Candidatus Acetothermia bacterium]